MEFKLNEVVTSAEMAKYKVIKKIKGDLRNPKGQEIEEEYPMFLYKKTLRTYNPDIGDGGRISGQLCGKILKIYPLKYGDYILIEDERYKVTEVLPRLRADFKEFVLEKTDE
ncbi:hypothetical protein DW261_03470 [Fusobacterium varium]|uniref:hypothetical protein n=1 Tax=Fusobacterium varium TaxID=856 RepID=UPI000E4934E2|nr:hypothetical protein [Fusobacterium varium]RHG37466.1 hypothetical protein DW261_03470 [Fusobacterium varium]